MVRTATVYDTLSHLMVSLALLFDRMVSVLNNFIRTVAWVKRVNFRELTITIFPTPIMMCFWKVEGLDIQETLTEMAFSV